MHPVVVKRKFLPWSIILVNVNDLTLKSEAHKLYATYLHTNMNILLKLSIFNNLLKLFLALELYK